MIYFIILIILFIPVVKFDLMRQEKGQQVWYYFSLLLLILLAGLRYRVGGDTLVYMRMFESYPTITELKYFDFESAPYNPLWYLYNAPFKSLDSFSAFQIIQAIIVNIIFFRFFKKYTPYYFTGIFIYYFAYYCYFNMEIQREILCICIFMISYAYLIRRKMLKYYLCCVLALFIHFSSILMLFLPLLLFIRKEPWKVAFILSIILIFLLGVIDVIPIFLYFMFDGVMLKLAEIYFEREINLVGASYQFVQCLPILIFMYIRAKNQINSHSDIDILMIGYVIIYIFTMYVGGFERLLNYFKPFYILYIVNTGYKLCENKFHVGQTTILLASFAIFITFFSFTYFYLRDRSEDYPEAKTYDRYFPYYSIFAPQMSEKREGIMQNERGINFY